MATERLCHGYIRDRRSRITGAIRHLVHAPEAGQFRAGVQALLIIMLAIMAGTVVDEIVIWGILFMFLGEFSEIYEAVYHSAVNFASLGYGDIVMSKPWKLLGPLEAVNGVLMLGMTAAALMVVLQYLIKTQRDTFITGDRTPDDVQ
ncbi:MAG: potassium channel family protein [Methylococcaceae bacterium]|nr:potassium channel family protein [Methylococcaceae bacterium]